MSPPWALARGSFNIITSVRGMMGGCCQHEHFCLRIHVLPSLEPNHSNVRPNHSDRLPNHSHISRKVLAFLIPKDSHIRWNYVRKQELMAGVTCVITSEILWQKELLAELIVMIWSYGRSGFYGIRNHHLCPRSDGRMLPTWTFQSAHTCIDITGTRIT